MQLTTDERFESGVSSARVHHGASSGGASGTVRRMALLLSSDGRNQQREADTWQRWTLPAVHLLELKGAPPAPDARSDGVHPGDDRDVRAAELHAQKRTTHLFAADHGTPGRVPHRARELHHARYRISLLSGRQLPYSRLRNPGQYRHRRARG
uniref:(northern house mosquito) hypothetical protein n=1 Tax=Culex pipiens TaxID=7175 RepID=A0A8D8CPL6_CULPI